MKRTGELLEAAWRGAARGKRSGQGAAAGARCGRAAWLAALLLCGLCPGLASAALGEVGHLRVRSYTPADYGAAGQSWAVVQDERGVLFVGNNDGVLEHDGETWRLIGLSNASSVRSLAVGPSGRVYVGATGELGVLRPERDGTSTYLSLRRRADGKGPDFNEIWAVLCLGEDVFFQADGVLFRLRGGQLRSWEHGEGFGAGFAHGGRLYLCSSGPTLLELDGDELGRVPVKGMKEGQVTVALPGEDGGVVIGTAHDGLFHLTLARGEGGETRAEATPFLTEADELLKRSTLYSGLRLADGRWALGTNLAGVVILDRQGRLERHIDIEEGLENQEVQRIFQDREGNLWLALNNGLAWVDLASGLSFWGRAHGLKNLVATARRFAGQLYVGSFDGLHRLVGNRLVSVPGLKGGVVCLLAFEPPGEPGRPILLAGTTEGGLAEVRGDRAEPLTSSGQVVCLHQERSDPARLWLGTTEGLWLATYERGRWSLATERTGVDDVVRGIAEDADGSLWFATETQGLYRLEGGRPVRFGRAQGLPGETNLGVFLVKGRLLVTAAGELLELDAARRRLEPSAVLAGAFERGTRVFGSLAEDAAGRLWALGEDADSHASFVGVLLPGPGGSSRWVEEAFRPLEGIILNSLTVEPDGTVWIASDAGLYRYRGALEAPAAPWSALVRRVELGLDAGRPTPGAVPPHAAWANVVPFRLNSARFTFAAPTFSSPGGPRYRTFLEGFDPGWSEWLPDTKREYTNLAERRYRFHVQARNVYGQESREAVCELTVLAPWYRTWWAWLAWGALATGLVWGIAALNTTRLRRAKARLERIVAERTAEVVAQKEEIEAKNRKITDSIVYASRIQRAMLPPEGVVAETTESHFILYRPRDIVSGDFYWFKRVARQVFLVVADCTGHGVPGAFMSVLGISLLNEIISGEPVPSPGEILFRLRERVVDSLRQSDEEGSSRDGLDIALCAIDLDTLTLRFSGAHHPLWLFRGGAPDELVELKGDRMPVGFHARKRADAFTAHHLQLARGDVLYLFSDGFVSQFGGPDRATFKVSRLREVLRAVQGRPLPEQREILERTLAEWMAGEEQIDDILVLGVRV